MSGFDSSPFRRDIMKGKVLFVTGGGSGIGYGICRTFAAHGATIAMMGRKQHKLDKACAAISQDFGVPVYPIRGDVRDMKLCQAAVQQVQNACGKIDILVNCAAGNFMADAEAISLKGYKTVIDIDLNGTFTMCKAALPALKKSDSALIINITATLQYVGQPFQVHAASAKAGIDVITRTLGVEWGSDFGIRSVGIAPGPIAGTEGGPTGRVFGSFLAGQDVADFIPIARWGEVEDIGFTALFVASSAGSYINAETIVVDGGQWHGTTRMFRMAKEPLREATRQAREAHARKNKISSRL